MAFDVRLDPDVIGWCTNGVERHGGVATKADEDGDAGPRLFMNMIIPYID